MTEQMPQQQMIGQYQAYQQQLQSVFMQKENIKIQTLEIEKALEELDASKEENAYKIVGPIMIKKTKNDIKTELKEKLDDFELRTKTLNSAEEKITSKLKGIETEIRKMMEKDMKKDSKAGA